MKRAVAVHPDSAPKQNMLENVLTKSRRKAHTACTLTEPVGAPLVVKRRRGRPRKVNVGAEPSPSAVKDTAPKVEVEDAADDPDEECIVVQRKRPRKSVVQDEVAVEIPSHKRRKRLRRMNGARDEDEEDDVQESCTMAVPMSNEPTMLAQESSECKTQVQRSFEVTKKDVQESPDSLSKAQESCDSKLVQTSCELTSLQAKTSECAAADVKEEQEEDLDPEECQRLMLKPPYDPYGIPRPPLNEVDFESSSEVFEVVGRSKWVSLLPEMMLVCNEAARRATVANDPRAKFFCKPLAADYMYDRVVLATDEPRGYVCRERHGERRLQGFVMVGTFASWDSTLRWSSTDTRAWGVPEYDQNRTRSSAKSRRSAGNSATSPRKRPGDAAATERKIKAFVEAGDHAAEVAARIAAEERRDVDGRIGCALEATSKRVSARDDRFTEWPSLLEISLLGALGCGRRLVERVVAVNAPRYDFAVLQATEAAVQFYEKRGFVRVGALAKYRDRKDMPDVAYRHWNDRFTVGSQAHGASHMMAMAISDRAADLLSAARPQDEQREMSTEAVRAEAQALARAALMTNTNVVGGSGVFRELVVIAQGRAGKMGANDATLSRSLAEALVLFKSNSCGAAKLVLKRDVLGITDDELTNMKRGVAPAKKRSDNPATAAHTKRIAKTLVPISLFVDSSRVYRPPLKARVLLRGYRRRKIVSITLVGRSAVPAALLPLNSNLVSNTAAKVEPSARHCKPPAKRRRATEAASRRDNGREQLSVGDSVMFRFNAPTLWDKLILKRRPARGQYLIDDRFDDGRRVPRENVWIVKCSDESSLMVALNPEDRGDDRRKDRWFPFDDTH